MVADPPVVDGFTRETIFSRPDQGSDKLKEVWRGDFQIRSEFVRGAGVGISYFGTKKGVGKKDRVFAGGLGVVVVECEWEGCDTRKQS